jgi:hypothetical protein
MVTSAHRVEVDVGADGPASAPPPRPPPQRRRRAPSAWTFRLLYIRVGSTMVTLVVEPAPLGGMQWGQRSEMREMAAGKGTGRAGRPPLMGK